MQQQLRGGKGRIFCFAWRTLRVEAQERKSTGHSKANRLNKQQSFEHLKNEERKRFTERLRRGPRWLGSVAWQPPARQQGYEGSTMALRRLGSA